MRLGLVKWACEMNFAYLLPFSRTVMCCYWGLHKNCTRRARNWPSCPCCRLPLNCLETLFSLAMFFFLLFLPSSFIHLDLLANWASGQKKQVIGCQTHIKQSFHENGSRFKEERKNALLSCICFHRIQKFMWYHLFFCPSFSRNHSPNIVTLPKLNYKVVKLESGEIKGYGCSYRIYIIGRGRVRKILLEDEEAGLQIFCWKGQ